MSTGLVSIMFAYYLFEQYVAKNIKDKTQFYMQMIVAFTYLWCLERIW